MRREPTRWSGAIQHRQRILLHCLTIELTTDAAPLTNASIGHVPISPAGLDTFVTPEETFDKYTFTDATMGNNAGFRPIEEMMIRHEDADWECFGRITDERVP